MSLNGLRAALAEDASFARVLTNASRPVEQRSADLPPAVGVLVEYENGRRRLRGDIVSWVATVSIVAPKPSGPSTKRRTCSARPDSCRFSSCARH